MVIERKGSDILKSAAQYLEATGRYWVDDLPPANRVEDSACRRLWNIYSIAILEEGDEGND